MKRATMRGAAAMPVMGLAGICALSAVCAPSAGAQPGSRAPDRVPREVIQEAMRQEAALGYNLLASTNSTRFETSVILRVVTEAAARERGTSPLLLDHEDWYEAYRTVLNLEPGEVPQFIALGHDYRQDRIVDYDPQHTGIRVKEGFAPDRAVRVTVGWPDEPGAPDRYTFTDTTTSPHLRITNRRRIRYWLLDYGDIVVQDRIEGVQARPLGGALGTLFSIVGDGSAVQNRIAIAADGLVVTYATAKKGPFKVQPLTVTYLDGTVETEFPPDRHDLLQLTWRIKQPLKVEYPEDG